MTELDRLYARLLQVGFIVLRQAVDSGNPEWVRAEVELLHNVPSLLGENNPERHRYFWDEERSHYIDRVTTHGPEEARSRMQTYYEPVWSELEPLILAVAACRCSQAEGCCRTAPTTGEVS